MTVVKKILAGVVTAALLAAAMWLTREKPHLKASLHDPITASGHIGAVVSNRVFSAELQSFDVANALVKHDVIQGDTTMPAQGVFVITHLRVKSARKPVRLGHVRLATRDNVSYRTTGRVAVIVDNDTYQPMLWGKATFVFEIPEDRLTGAHLIIGRGRLVNQLSAEIDIDLDIDKAKAKRLLTDAPDYSLSGE